MHEIEMRALLTKEQYKALKLSLPQQFTRTNQEFLTTHKFRPHDVRVRHSDEKFELVFKDKDPLNDKRKEITISLPDKAACDSMVLLLNELGLKQDPSWTTKKHEFVCERNGHNYKLSLQHIENFAYILEAEIMAEEGATAEHEQHLATIRDIVTDLGCEPINKDEFKESIRQYIKEFSQEE